MVPGEDAHRHGAAVDDMESSAVAGVNGGADATEQSQKPALPADPPQPEPLFSPTTSDDDLLTKTFRFLSTATPETLGAIGVGLAASTYLVLGKLGLVLVGAFGGVALFISWEARNPELSRAIKGERGVDVLARVLASKSENKDGSASRENREDEYQWGAQSFDDFRPETRDALNNLVDAIIRDYVKWWYGPIVPRDDSFPASCRKVLTSYLLSVSNHLSRKRPADAFLDFLTNSSSIVIVLFAELSAAFAELPTDSKMTAADAIYNYLSANPDSSLANLLSQKQQASKFKMVAEDLLAFLDRSSYDCDPARIFLREILASVILEKTLETCSKPEWINGWIVYLLEAGEPDLSQAIDVGMQTGPEANNNAFIDIDGNVGNIGLSKGNRNSFDMEKARKRESMGHKKQLSKAEEEMEEAMEEMERLNKMIAEDEARRARAKSASEPSKETKSAADASERLAGAMKRNANELEIQPNLPDSKNDATGLGVQSPPASAKVSPKDPSSSGDEQSGKGEPIYTPITPRSSMAESPSQTTSPNRDSGHFTNFDQLVPPAQDDADLSDSEQRKPVLTLHKASVTIHDEALVDTGRIRSKPSWDFLIQIEPATTQFPGWMNVRRYSDFERLHEVMRRIATISGAKAFTEQHAELPSWRIHTRASLRGELERYLRDALWYQPLAESEGMKRFLEKNSGHAPSASKSGFQLQAFENMGKNVLGVLSNAPKGMNEGGKALVGGVTGVLGNMGLGQRKNTASSLQDVTAYTNRLSVSTPPRVDSSISMNGSNRKTRDSLDSQRSSVVSTQPARMAPMERRPSYNSQSEAEGEPLSAARSDRWELMSPSTGGSRQHSRASSLAPARSPSVASFSNMKLPPPPDAIPDDYDALSNSNNHEEDGGGRNPKRNSTMAMRSRSQSLTNARRRSMPAPTSGYKQFPKLSEQETRVAVELLFAVINELYTLSSAWNIRRTLLTAAKSFLLRPGNPSLASIQTLIQTSVLEANTSDEGVARHLAKLRENTLPTEEELAAWPAEMSAEDKERLRARARALLIKSGVPAALMGVMGQAATSEAMGRIFDCLQVEEVARGLIFGVLLQAVRVVTH
ncbi:uncharacterized protein E0L32_006238 [Thyridium curvatum]|uniref:PXA domain-containing protein n=1 Tax=Thyridium curvatum TaxID=1093900 RepID=A0A507AQZ1_9PEZI|nr:uncharacterized protein E0L32_006238 [Thyridium curvatum]TPX13265.1 hypothetical protein E0L32_006238 [Thyridium curvatum]